MENKAHAFAAGVFVLVVTTLLFGMVTWLMRDTVSTTRYEMTTTDAVTGLQPQAAVRYRGVPVGKVMRIGFDPKAAGHVLVRLALDESAPVTASTFATLGFQGVTGLAFVQLDDSGESKTMLPTSEQTPARIPMRASLLSKLSDQGVAILSRVEQTSERINALLSDKNQQQMMATIAGFGDAAQSVQKMADRMQKLSSNLDDVLNAQLGPQRVNIPRFVDDASTTLKSLQTTAAGVDETVLEFRKTASAFTAMAERLNAKGGAVDRMTEGAAALTQGAAALTEAGQAFNAGTLPRLNRTSDEATRTARQVQRAVSVVEDNPQSLIFGNGLIAPGPGD